jgi:hypothetical protein
MVEWKGYNDAAGMNCRISDVCTMEMLYPRYECAVLGAIELEMLQWPCPGMTIALHSPTEVTGPKR